MPYSAFPFVTESDGLKRFRLEALLNGIHKYCGSFGVKKVGYMLTNYILIHKYSFRLFGSRKIDVFTV